jgi:mono/diheme cytochrome c family protein
MNKLKISTASTGVLVLALAALSLNGCFGTDSSDDPNPCADDASLCLPREALRDTGEVYFGNCSGCHGENGNGQGHGGPRLGNSDFFMNNRQRVINLVLRGNQETPPYIPTFVINGDTIHGGGMPAWGTPAGEGGLSNVQIAGILTYIRSVLNDSLVTNCNPAVTDPNGHPICTKTARSAMDMDLDTVAVWEVKAVRDTLIDKGVLTAP